MTQFTDLPKGHLKVLLSLVFEGMTKSNDKILDIEHYEVEDLMSEQLEEEKERLEALKDLYIQVGQSYEAVKSMETALNN